MRNIRKGNSYRKDDKGMLVTNDWLWTAAITILLAIAGCAGVYFYFRNHGKKQKQAKRAVDSQNEHMQGGAEKRMLAEEYCQAARKLEEVKADQVYRNAFMKAAPFFQILLGAQQRYLKKDSTDSAFWEELSAALYNYRIEPMLDSDGFHIKEPEKDFDQEALFHACIKMDKETLKKELEKQRRQLKQYQGYLDCKQIIKQSGKPLYLAIQDIHKHEVSACLNHISLLKEVLENNGCYPVYGDDRRVAFSEAMRVDFREDVETATELPGLYSRDKSGNYHLIGTFGGTFRKE